MAQTIKLKRSGTSGRLPTTSDLELGEVAINTYDGKMYIKKNVGGTESIVEIGSGGGSGLASSFTLYEYTATSGQTTFSGSDGNSNTLAYDTGTPPKILVYLNGVLLDHTTDYTATNGTSVVLTSAAATSDLVQIAAYNSSVSTTLDIDLSDNQKLLLGDDDDLQLYHDGTHSYIDDAGTGGLYLRSDNFRVLKGDGSERMIQADDDGAVLLYYDGSAKIQTTSTGVDITGSVTSDSLVINGTNANLTLGTSGNDISFGRNADNYINAQTGTSSNIVINPENRFVVNTADTERMRIDSSGRVGIGTSTLSSITSSVATLSLGGTNAGTSGGIAYQTNGTPEAYHYTTGDFLLHQAMSGVGQRFLTNNTEAMRITSAGNVGIGTTSPNYKLDVVSAGGGINIGGSGAYLRWNSGDIQIKNEGSYKMGFYTYNSSDAALNRHMVIDTNGYVGIGTASPAVELDIKRHTNAYPLRIGSSQGEGRAIVFADVAGTPTKYNWIAGTQYNINDGFEITPSTAVGGYTFSSPALVIKQDGKVGIGTTTPDSKLTVNTTTTGDGIELQSSEVSIAKLSRHVVSSTVVASLDGVSGRPIHVGGVVNEDVILANAGGNVGIGTTSPQRPLHIHRSAASQDVRIQLSDGTTTDAVDKGFNIIKNTAQNAYLWNYQNASMLFGTNNVERLVITSSGNFEFNNGNFTEVGTISSGAITSSASVIASGNSNSFGNTTITNLSATSVTTSGSITASGNSNSFGNITTTGYLRGPSTFTIDPATHGDNTGTVVIAGNLQVDGTTTTINSTTLTVDDKNITLASGSSNAAAANGAGITVDCGSGTDATLTYDGTNDEWDFNKNVKVSGSVGVTNIVTNKVVKFNGTILDDSSITDTGSLITLGTSTDVSGPLQFTSNVSFSSSEPGRIYKASNHGLAFHGVTGTENDFAMFTPAGQLMIVNPTGTNNVALIPTAGGNVGIGTASPSYTLTVKDNSANTYIRFENTTTNLGWIGYHGDGDLSFWTNSSTRSMNITSSGNVGIGIEAAAAKLQIEEAGIDTTTTSTTATTQVAIDTFAAATFRSARYTIQVTNSTDSTYHLTEILLIHDGTTPQITEYGTIFTGSAEATFDADISSGNVRLLATPATTDSMTFKVVRHCITV